MRKILLVPLLAALAMPPACGESMAEENARLREELLRLRSETDRLSALLLRRENELKKLRVWLANVRTDGRITAVSDREQRLLAGLKTLADSAGELVLRSVDLGELLKPSLETLPLGSADRVRLVMALEALERSAARVNFIAGTARPREDNMLRRVRVMAVKPELNMAVIAAGALDGVFPGMTFVSADGKVKLRVAETRPFISGAVPVTGALTALPPGTSVRLQITKSPEGKRGI